MLYRYICALIFIIKAIRDVLRFEKEQMEIKKCNRMIFKSGCGLGKVLLTQQGRDAPNILYIKCWESSSTGFGQQYSFNM